MQSVRIVELPSCRMVSSGAGMFGQEKFDRFMAWMDTQEKDLFPCDFLYFDQPSGSFVWLYRFRDGMNVPEEFEIVDFSGGLYAVATDIDQQTDTDMMKFEVDVFLAENGLKRDLSRPELGHIITSPLAQTALGYEQMDYFTPVTIRRQNARQDGKNG